MSEQQAVQESGGLDTFASAAVDSQMSNDRDTSINVDGAAPSFDDFDSMETARQEFKESKGIKEKKQKSEPKETKEDSQESRKAVSDAKEASDANVDPNITPDPSRTELKMMKLMDGDNTLEINENVMVPYTVDGEKKEISLAEMRNAFSGEIAHDRRFQELDKSRKAFEADRDEFNGIMDNFTKYYSGEVDDKGPIDAMIYLVDSFGGDGYNFYKEVRNSLIENADQYLNLSESERAVIDARKENEFLQSRLKSAESDLNQQRAARELSKRQEDALVNFDLSEDEYMESKRFLEEEVGLEELGLTELTPEYIAEFHSTGREVNRARDLVMKLDPKLAENRKLLKEVALLKREGDSDEQILSALEDILGSKRKRDKTLNSKTSEVVTRRSEKVEEPDDGYESFDDYDDY